MNKADVLEIKKQFKKDSNIITKIVGCYVDAEKEVKFIQKDAFYSLGEEDCFKYEEIFRKTLSGTLGRNLINIELENAALEEGGAGEFLFKLRQSKLEDDELLEVFFKKIISGYEYNENYFIILIDIVYDIPGKTNDNMLMEDASDEVYHALLCSICPVKLSKASLGYNAIKNNIENRVRDWIVDMPMQGFLYPSFDDRKTNVYEVLYFSKKINEIMPNFIYEMFDSEAPLSVSEQKESVLSAIQQVGSENMNVEMMAEVYDKISDMIAEHDEKEGPLILDKNDMLRVLSSAGVDDESLDLYDKLESSDVKVVAENIIDVKKIEIKRPGISIKIDPDCMEQVSTGYIDGKKCILIAAEDVEINGVMVKTI